MGGQTPLLAFCIACNVLFGAFACVVYRYDLSYINSLSRKDAYEHAHLAAALQVLLIILEETNKQVRDWQTATNLLCMSNWSISTAPGCSSSPAAANGCKIVGWLTSLRLPIWLPLFEAHLRGLFCTIQMLLLRVSLLPPSRARIIFCRFVNEMNLVFIFWPTFFACHLIFYRSLFHPPPSHIRFVV